MKIAYLGYPFLILLIFGMLLPFAPSTFNASATPIANPILDVTIESIRFPEFDDDLFPKDSKFFAVVQIPGYPTAYNCGGRMAANADGLIPANWKFSQQIDRSSFAFPLPVYIWIEEITAPVDDEPIVEAFCSMHVSGSFNQFRVEDDTTREEGRKIRADVTLSPCEARLERWWLPTSCGTSMAIHPLPRDNIRSADITFRVDVQDPASATGLGILCTHAPIWPQATDAVTITANTIDDTLASTSVDSIEIWVNTRAGPVQTGSGSSLTYSAGPFNGAFSYGCRAIHNGVPIFSGWRTVTVGAPSVGQAVPILNNGFRENSVDIVFIPDKDSYTGASDAQFLSDVSKAIGAYYNEKVFLDHQQQINFWIAQGSGDANGCATTGPSNWDTDYAFADAGGVIHRGDINDCHPGGTRLFSGDATRVDLGRLLGVIVHETGHQPFGLADEYCCTGGYFDAQNLFSNLDTCKYVSSTTTCQQLTGSPTPGAPPITFPWYRSDPSPNHLMDDNGRAQKLDERGINRVFDECARLNC